MMEAAKLRGAENDHLEARSQALTGCSDPVK